LIFAAKTTASALLALLIAFAFNLDQPKWALLTVFIVAQPQSGFVLAKSFYRIIGTLAGAACALVLVSLFAQERVLFLGALASWIGACTYASKHARNFASYGFVLAGYTVAIVGIPGAADPGNAFFIAVARVTEISLGIITTAIVNHLVLPDSVANSLHRAIITGRAEFCDYAVAVLRSQGPSSLRIRLLHRVISIESLRSSAVVEDREIRQRSDALRRVEAAMVRVIQVCNLLARSLDWLRQSQAIVVLGLDETIAQAAATIDLWRVGQIDSLGLKRAFAQASVRLPLARNLCCDLTVADNDAIGGATVITRLYEFFAAFEALAEAYEAYLSPNTPSQVSSRVAVSNDRGEATWAGIRAGLSLLLVGTFWILTAWPSGATATILASVVAARLATMERPLMAATGGALIIALATIPSFVLVEVLLPNASGFEMFGLILAPMLFLFAYLMARPKTAGMSFVAALYFASVGGFQDRMTYDPIGFLNTSIALTLAVATAALLFAIVAPETPGAARRRFLRVARRILKPMIRRRPHVDLAAFETTLADSLDQLCRSLKPDRAQDLATVEAGIALTNAGRELIRVRDIERQASAAIEVEQEVLQFLSDPTRRQLERVRRAANGAAIVCLSELRHDQLGVTEARAAVRKMIAFAAIRDEIEASADILVEDRREGAPKHAA
jgi:uncharacterized membrane protein YccC